MKNALILINVVLLLPLCGCGQSPKAKEYNIPAVTSCDLYANPRQFDGQYLEVSGNINVQFEYSALVCWEENVQKQPLASGIWLSINLASIQKRSPAFYEQIKDGIDLANTGGGGLIGKLRFRGRFTVADWVRSGKSKDDRIMSGFGHLGGYGGQITVEEVMDYQPKKYDMFATVNKACQFFGIPPCDKSDLNYETLYNHVAKLFPKKTQRHVVVDAIGKLRKNYEKAGNAVVVTDKFIQTDKVVVQNTAERIILRFPVFYETIIDEYVMDFVFSDEGELTNIGQRTQSWPSPTSFNAFVPASSCASREMARRKACLGAGASARKNPRPARLRPGVNCLFSWEALFQINPAERSSSRNCPGERISRP